MSNEQKRQAWESEELPISSTIPLEQALKVMGDTISLAAMAGQVIKVRDVIVHDATINSNTGETVEGKRIVFIDTEGIAYHTVSNAVLGTLKLLAAVYGNPPWPDGLALKVVEIPSRTNPDWRIMRLVPA